jgi:hypothetical protein
MTIVRRTRSSTYSNHNIDLGSAPVGVLITITIPLPISTSDNVHVTSPYGSGTDFLQYTVV